MVPFTVIYALCTQPIRLSVVSPRAEFLDGMDAGSRGVSRCTLSCCIGMVRPGPTFEASPISTAIASQDKLSNQKSTCTSPDTLCVWLAASGKTAVRQYAEAPYFGLGCAPS